MSQKRFDSGIQNLSDDRKESLRKRLAEASNKSDAWEEAKKDKVFSDWDGRPILKGSLGTVKDQLIEAGILPEAEQPLPFTTVDEYRRFKEEQDALPAQKRDKHLSVPSHCPPPLEGVYATIRNFNRLADTDRHKLLMRANEAAAEGRRSELPSMYVHGLAMSWNQLVTLMEANGFETGRDGFTDPRETDTGSGIKSDEDSVQVRYDLDMERDDVERRTISLSGKMISDMEKLAAGTLPEGIKNKARCSVFFECILRIGFVTAVRMIMDGTLEFVVEKASRGRERIRLDPKISL